jgi:hypothetical protein
MDPEPFNEEELVVIRFSDGTEGLYRYAGVNPDTGVPRYAGVIFPSQVASEEDQS